MNWWAHAVERHRGLAAGLMILMTALALAGVPRLDYETDPRSELLGNHPDRALLEELFADFGSDDLDCVLLIRGQDLFTPDSVTALRRLDRALEEIEGIREVYSLDDVPILSHGRPHALLPQDLDDESALDRARREALAHPLVAGQILAHDAGMTLLIARLDGNLTLIHQLRPVVEEISRLARNIANDSGLDVLLTGIPALRVDVYTTVQRENIRSTLVAILVAVIMAMLLFRRPSAIAIAATPPLLGVLWTMGTLGWLNQKMMTISVALPCLLLGIGFSDAAHLLVHIRREIARGTPSRRASRLALRRLGPACVLTSLTTAAGFGSLTLASSSVIQRFGLHCAAGSLLTLIAVLSAVPLLTGTRLGDRCAPRAGSLSEDRLANLLIRLVDPLLAHPRLVGLLGVALTVGLTATALRLRVDTLPMKAFAPRSESARAFGLLEEAFGGGLVVHALVDWRGSADEVPSRLIPALTAVHSIFEQDPFTVDPVSALTLLQTVGLHSVDGAAALGILAAFPPDLSAQLINPERRRARVSARVRDVGADASIPAFTRLDERLAALSSQHEPFTFRLTGTAVAVHRSLHTMVVDLVKSLALASVIIFGAISIGFRSVRYGLISVIPNLFPLVSICALMVWTDQPLLLVSVIIFTMSLGIAVDDTIHVLTRFRREIETRDTAREAARRTFLIVGRALVMTTLVFVAGFASIMVSELSLLRMAAMLFAFAVTAALVGDLLILPALLVCFAGTHRPDAPNRPIPPSANAWPVIV